MSTRTDHTLSLGGTDRRDAWWIYPAFVAVTLTIFGIYATWAAAQGVHYHWQSYLSPFYSPTIKPAWLPEWLSPAFLILGAPLGFRATCYYYRKAYYRGYFLSPPACAVGKGKSSGYTGERAFPFILQNLHRFFLYLAIIILFVLWYDVILAFIWDGRFGMGLGTVILFANAALLTGYTLGCHSLRHLIGGKMDCFSCHTLGKQAHSAWQGVTWLNQRHEQFAWSSLFAVGIADLYVRLGSMGFISPSFDLWFTL